MLTLNAAAVRAAMLKRGVGVMELAELARIPPKTISLAHRRDRGVHMPTLSRLATALQVPPLTLVKAAEES